MARDIDRLMSHVQQLDMPSVMKQVILNRLDPIPTAEEIEQAALDVFVESKKSDGGVNIENTVFIDSSNQSPDDRNR